MQLEAMGTSRALLGRSGSRARVAFFGKDLCSAPRGLLRWVAMRWQGGAALPPEWWSLAVATEGGHYTPPKNVPDTKVWGSALTLQLVVKGVGDTGDSMLRNCFAISGTDSVTSVTSCFILNTFACRQQFCSLSYIAIETIFRIPLFVVHFC